jgi:hypothetical protein
VREGFCGQVGGRFDDESTAGQQKLCQLEIQEVVVDDKNRDPADMKQVPGAGSRTTRAGRGDILAGSGAPFV